MLYLVSLSDTCDFLSINNDHVRNFSSKKHLASVVTLMKSKSSPLLCENILDKIKKVRFFNFNISVH